MSGRGCGGGVAGHRTCRRLRTLFPAVDLGVPEFSPNILGVLLDFLLVTKDVPLIHSVPCYQTFRSYLFC